MTIVTPRRDRTSRPGTGLSARVVGNATVVHLTGRISDEAAALATRVAADPHHDLVVVDLPPGSPVGLWDEVAGRLPHRRRGVRLVVGGRSRETTTLAGQWLAERIGRTVVAPDGAVHPGAGGSLFVHSGRGTGWVRLRPGRSPRWEAKRFPQPRWESDVFAEDWPTSARGIAEPIPGGLWIRPIGHEPLQREHRRRLVEHVPCQAGLVTVVVGCPGSPPLPLGDVARLWRCLSRPVRERARFAQLGPVALPASVPLGQALADSLGKPVACYTGIPVGDGDVPDVYTVDDDGGLGWNTLVREVRYAPAGDGGPELLSYRCPIPGLPAAGPAVYRYAPDAVVEVVQSGLWIRPPDEGPHAAAVRRAPWDRAAFRVMFDAGPTGDRMRELAHDVLACLHPSIRQVSRILPAHAVLDNCQHVQLTTQPSAAISYLSNEPAVDATSVDATSVDATSIGATPVERSPIEAALAGAATVGATPADAAPDESEASPHPPAEAAPAGPPPEIGPDMLAGLRLESATPDYLPMDDHAPAPADRPQGIDPPDTSVERPQGTDPPDTAVDRPQGTDPSPQSTHRPQRTDPSSAADRPQWTDPARAIAVFQPTPDAAASALLPARGIEEERAWLRRTLGPKYGTQANAVSRVLSVHPGFQGPLTHSSPEALAAAVTDAVAVRLHLTADGEAIDQALRTATVGPHVPFGRCVVSGLGKLPSHRGPTVFHATPTPDELELYRDRNLLTEWGFVHALTAPCARQTGTTDVLIWSLTARRTRLLEQDERGTEDRVLFVPGTSFKVLRVDPPSDARRGLILLRELAAGEIDAGGRVDAGRVSLDDVATSSLQDQLERWAAAEPVPRVADAATGRFGALPGLLSTGGER